MIILYIKTMENDVIGYLGSPLANVAFLALLLIGASLIETVLPLVASQRSARRVSTNLTVTAIYFLLNAFLLVGLLGALNFLGSNGRYGLGLLPVSAAWIVGIVLLDAATWTAHWSLHKSPLLWRAHAVHHSDRQVDATTTFRQHPIEGLTRIIFLAIPALAAGVPAETFAAYRALSALNAILEHTNVRLWQPLDTLLSFIWVTPNLHKVHHSNVELETDSNYGNLLSLFDRLFGTFTPSSRCTAVTYGLHNAPPSNVTGLMAMPFRR